MSASCADLTRFVDPFVGTAGTGHTTPAACVPFGLVQAGPDTGNGDWAHCSGYIYGDKAICGFTQTHLNGTGCPDLGDVRILPVGDKERCGRSPRLTDCAAAFDKTTEVAAPGYYAVTLKDPEARVEIAAAEHSVLYRFSGSKGGLRILVDCAYGITRRDSVKEVYASEVRLDGKRGLAGTNRRRCWVDRAYSYAVVFDHEATKVEELPRREGQKAPQYVFTFDGVNDVMVKIGMSASGRDNGGDVALQNLTAEISGWDFDRVRAAARARWNEVLGVAMIEGTDEQKQNWYTALYHLFVQPNNIADVGGKPFYSTFSCWDTFRAAGPLYTILCPERASEFVDSMLEQGRRTGYLPIWTLWGRDNQCMIGTHSVPMIVDWFLKEQVKKSGEGEQRNAHSDYWKTAYAQIKETLTKAHSGRKKENWELYDRYGYYPFDKIKGESVSRTMECAYDDWCAGRMAEELGYKEDAAFFFRRASYWKNVFDSSIGLVRGKDSQGKWRMPYDPYALGQGAGKDNDFTEGNAFQYSWHIMQDVDGLVVAMGGKDKITRKLDALFTAPSKTEGMGEVLDVTGLIGQYVHGNEPSHHVIYFYPQLGQPEKAAVRIREVFDKFYLPKPDGLCGNDDCGQMSAWYLFSAMGFYPFNPCGGEYILGAPQIPKVALKVKKSGKGEQRNCSPSTFTSFTITAKNLSKENKYVKSVTLNGQPITDWKIRHEDVVKGGELVFEMCGCR